jgi:1-acyl-sn-glycerol-3-phosphate acyltransferase
MLYSAFKPLISDATSRFFRQIHLRGTPCENGALLVAANHVNVVLDGVLIIINFKRQLWLLIKGAVFRSAPLRVLLSWMHFVPVYRRRDNPDEVKKNEQVFARVVESLRMRRGVLIFPEGESHTSWHLAPLHTGLARIALQAQAQFGETEPVRIQPVGITYTDFFAFNSSVTVCFDEPIAVLEYLERYKENAEEAVRQLTEDVAVRLKSVTVDFEETRNQDLFEMINQLLQSRGDGGDDQQRLRHIAEALSVLHERCPDQLADFAERLRLHIELSNSLKIDGSERLETRQSRLFMFLLSPFILFGLTVLFIPYRLSWWISKRLSKKSSQYSSYAFSVGFLLFPLWYLLLGVVFAVVTGRFVLGVAALFVLIGSGYFTSKYFNRFALYVFAMMWPGRKTPVDVLREMRESLLAFWQQLLEHIEVAQPKAE